MLKITVLTLLLIVLAQARENPFFPSSGDNDLYISSNKVQKVQNLERSSTTFPDSAHILKEVTFSYQNLDGSVESKTIEIAQAIDWHLPVFISQSALNLKNEKQAPINKKIEKKKFLKFNFIVFSIYNKKITIKTEDKLIRHFIMTKPQRIVLDFKRDASFRTKTKSLKNSEIQKVTLGNHDKYYRAVIHLDGQYRYRLSQNKSLLEITLR